VVPLLKQQTHLPVIVDPSHGTGLSWMVPAMAKAAIAAGADGLMIEVHNNPLDALSDGQQSLYPEDFFQLVKDIEKVAQAIGRKLFHLKPSPA
jgi:3-deoxy-7-phosphoheptulonate synthase